MPQNRLQEFLEVALSNPLKSESPDCSIVRVGPSQFLISTTDFFYPLVTDPYLQGKIACCNVLSDLYSLGVEKCDNMLMTLTVSTEMTDLEQEIITKAMIKGFYDTAELAETQVTGGQTIMNPSPIIGGVALSVVNEGEFIRPCGANVGDLLVLTKPLGTQIVVNVYEWFYTKRYNLEKLENPPSEEKVLEMFNKACESMSRLNKNAARMMRKHSAKGCTDVTGFGILGHAQNLVSIQHDSVDFIIHTFPVIKGVFDLDKKVRDFKLIEGLSAETSGGLLLAISSDNANNFIEELRQLDGTESWIIGEVVSGERKARIQDLKILEV